jgi:hypothetical protein
MPSHSGLSVIISKPATQKVNMKYAWLSCYSPSYKNGFIIRSIFFTAYHHTALSCFALDDSSIDSTSNIRIDNMLILLMGIMTVMWHFISCLFHSTQKSANLLKSGAQDWHSI